MAIPSSELGYGVAKTAQVYKEDGENKQWENPERRKKELQDWRCKTGPGTGKESK